MSTTNVFDLIVEMEQALSVLKHHALAYATLQRNIHVSKDIFAPFFEWVINVGDEPCKVITDSSVLTTDQRIQLFTILSRVHWLELQDAKNAFNDLVNNLRDSFGSEKANVDNTGNPGAGEPAGALRDANSSATPPAARQDQVIHPHDTKR